MSKRTTTRGDKTKTKKTIDLDTLREGGAKEELTRYEDDEKERTLNWTRTVGAGARKHSHFKAVGVLPATTRRTTKPKKDKPAKLNAKWRITRAEDKWEEDTSIIYIPDVYLADVRAIAPKSYTDEEDILKDNPEAYIPLWIAGPREAVKENLIHQRILPGGLSPDAYNKWFETVGITYDNYTNTKKKDYDALKETDKSFIKTKESVQVDVGKVNDLVWVSKLLRGKKGAVEILDVNSTPIGTYGGKLRKAPTNIFTDFLMKQIERRVDLNKVIFNISALTTELDSKVTKEDVPSGIDVGKGIYPAQSNKRPLGITDFIFTLNDKDYDLGDNFIWTSKIEPIDVLYAELEAVNKIEGGKMSYSYSGKQDTVKSGVKGLIRAALLQKRTAGDRSKVEAEEQVDAIYA